MVTETMQHVLKERMKSLDLCGPFQKIFGIRLKTFWQDNILGFDIVAFDKHLETPDGISLKDHIQNLYGNDGVECLDALLA